MSDDLVKRLSLLADSIELGDKLRWGEDSAALREAKDRIEELEARLEKAMGALDELITTYVWVREDEYERGWSEMSNAVHEATFVQMELKEQK